MFAQQPRPTSTPFYEKAKQAISERIYRDGWHPYNRIPSEAGLTTQFGFSRMTINHALYKLTDKDLLIRLQEIETFIVEPKGQSTLFEVRGIADEIVSHRHQHRCEVLLLGKTETDLIQAEALTATENVHIFHSRMVHFESEVPVQTEDRCMNVAVVPGYLLQDYTITTPHGYPSLITPLTEGEHIIEAVQATLEECVLPHILSHNPYLLVRRHIWSRTRIVLHTRLLFPGARCRLQGHFNSQFSLASAKCDC